MGKPTPVIQYPAFSPKAIETRKGGESKLRVIRDIWDMIQYMRYCHQMKKMTSKQQRIVGQKIYEEAYQVMKKHPGDKLGACGVTFTCPFSGHISYLIAKTFDERVRDEGDPTLFARVEHIESNKWLAFAIVRSATEQDAITAADACVMSSILQSGTVPPSFSKYLRAVRGISLPESPCDESEESFAARLESFQNVMCDVAHELGEEIAYNTEGGLPEPEETLS